MYQANETYPIHVVIVSFVSVFCGIHGWKGILIIQTLKGYRKFLINRIKDSIFCMLRELSNHFFKKNIKLQSFRRLFQFHLLY